MPRNAFIFLALATVSLPTSAAAQIYDYEPFGISYFQKVTWDDINRRTAETLKDAQEKVRRNSSPQGTPKKAAPRKAAPRQPISRPTTAQSVAPKATPVSSAALSFRPSGAIAQSKGLEALASRYSRAQQPVMRANYTTLITSFNDNVPRLYGVPKNNMATGTAALLTGAYAAYNNRTFPDAWVKPLVMQLEASMLEDNALASAPASDKETAYYIMVGTGMALNLAQAELAKKPDAREVARLKAAGRHIFQTMLQMDPDSVTFSESGMAVE